MKAALQLRPSQHLSLTPQLQQAIRLLQLSTVELQQEVQATLDENLMLEVDDNAAPPIPSEAEASENSEAVAQVPGEAQETTLNSRLADDLPTNSTWDVPHTPADTSGVAADDYDLLAQQSKAPSLQAHLRWQMQLAPFSAQDQLIADVLIDSIDNAGYLQIDLADIVTMFAAQGLAQQDIEAVLHRIQHFDPPGVAARNVQESLLLQAQQVLPEGQHKDQAVTLLTHYFDHLTARNEKKLCQVLQVSPAELQPILQQIRALHPHPGTQIGEMEPAYIVPDVLVTQQAGGWQVELNPETVPKLRVNAEYAALVQRGNQGEENQLLKEHLQTARGFIKNLQTRHTTILRVARCIVQTQADFFAQGVGAMKPLILQDVADTLELHESTISRVTANKYMHTPQGTFAFKYFFSSRVRMASEGVASATAVSALIKKIIQAESPLKPLSDNAVAHLLSEQGVRIARRTVTKYREALRIPASSVRRQLP